METTISSKTLKTTLVLLGLMIGIVIASTAQTLHQFTGIYTTDNNNIQVSITADGADLILSSNEKNVKAKIEVKRLVDKIRVIDVTTYFYEVSVKDASKDQIKTIEVVYNDSNGKAFIDIPGFSSFKRVRSI
ncbi:MAG: hypothetical protein JXQ96_21385 [Cyclobacteriaceae bacterium]